MDLEFRAIGGDGLDEAKRANVIHADVAQSGDEGIVGHVAQQVHAGGLKLSALGGLERGAKLNHKQSRSRGRGRCRLGGGGLGESGLVAEANGLGRGVRDGGKQQAEEQETADAAQRW